MSRILNLLRFHRSFLSVKNNSSNEFFKLAAVLVPQTENIQQINILSNSIIRSFSSESVWDEKKMIGATKQQQHIRSSNQPRRRDKKGKLETFDELFENLNSYFIVNGHVFSDIFCQTIEKLETATDLKEDHSLFLLESCANYLPTKNPDDRMLLFNQIWDHLKKFNLLKKSHYLMALKVFQTNRKSVSSIQNIFIDCPVKDDPQIYEGLIYLACENGDINQATEILSEMREKSLPLNENIFNALILGHSRNQDLVNCEKVQETMSAANLLPSSETMSQLIRAYIENEKYDKAMNFLNEHELSLNINQIAQLIKSSADKYQKNIVEKLLKLLPKDLINVKEIQGNLRNICIEFIYSDESDKAYMIVNAYPTPIFNDNENSDTFGVFLINEMIRSEQNPNVIIEICQKLIETKKNTRALHIACEIMLRRYPHYAFKYLKSLSKYELLRSHYFWPLFLYNFQKSGEIGVLNTLRSMSNLNVECDYETLSYYCLPRLSVTLNNPQKAIQTLEGCGLKTAQLLTPLISNLLSQQKQYEIIKLCELYLTKIDTSLLMFPLSYLAVNLHSNKSYSTFAKLMNSLSNKADNQKYDLAGHCLMETLTNQKVKADLEILTKHIFELNNANVKISSVAFESIDYHLSKFDTNKNAERARTILREMISKNLNLLSINSNEISSSSQNITHPRDMTLDELECHLVELESKRLNTRGVLRRLLQLCVRDNRLERALEIKKKCDESNVQVSPGMLASIFDLNIKLKNLKSAEDSMHKIRKTFPGFLIDEHKIIDFAGLLIENNQLERACNLIEQRAVTSKINGGDYLNKNIWNCLMKCAKLSSEQDEQQTEQSSLENNKTKQLFTLFKKYRFCQPSNVLLGPIIREYLYKNDIKSAVKEYEHFTELYRKTPLQFELMSLLVSISNGNELDRFKINESEGKELLQKVVTITSKIHGSINSNSSLLLAVAQSGTEPQLRKILINPEFRINTDALIKNCSHLSSTGSITTILKLAKASRGLGHVLKEQDLYNILMEQFVKDNDYEGALDLFDKLEADDDLKISQDFLKNLVDLLKINKIDIPTAISLRMQIRN